MTDPNQTLPRGVTPPREPSRETVLERRRFRRVTGLRAYAAALLITLGLLVFLAELYRHYFTKGYAIQGGPVALGACMAFVGFYMLDPKDSLGGGAFLVNSTVAILGTIRGGRRVTDPPVVVAEPPAAAAPPITPPERGEAP